MATDGDKIAAATLAAKLLDALPAKPMTSDQIPHVIELYGEILRQLSHINPLTGKPFTPEERQRLHLRTR